MSETMIERVAKAIEPNEFKWWQQRFDYEMRQSGDEVEARAYAESFFDRAAIYAKARAAIQAMREPTEDMRAARFRNLGRGGQAEHEAMIDAALKEQTK